MKRIKTIWNEEELFNYLKNNHISDISKTNGVYNPADCISYINNWLIELKARRRHFNLLLIEKIKYDELLIAADLNKMEPVYVCSTPAGVWQFFIKDIKIEWFKQDKLPVTTDFDNNDKTSKIVGFLHIWKGLQLERFELLEDWL